MGYVKYRYEDLMNLCETAFQKFGFSKEDSSDITDVLLLADLYGIGSHGMQRLVRYHKGIQNGIMKIDAPIEIVHDTSVSAVLDAHDGMGQLAGKKAMNMAINKAKTSGIGMVSVRNSNHYGIAGYYALIAEKEGLMGISMTNSEAIAVPTYGRMAMMGSNPIAIAFPAKPVPFLFDAATCVVTRGKVEVYNKEAKPLPIGWAIDHTGCDSSDAKQVLYDIANKFGGGIVPLGGSTEKFGGHKGYGYGMIVEIFTAILSGGLTGNHTHIGSIGRCCHSFIAVDLGVFGDREVIEDSLSAYLQEIRDSDKAEGANRIYTHGEKEIEAYKDRMENGIPVNENTVKEMKDMCNYLGLNMADYARPII